MYATLQQVAARVPMELIVQALDDNRDGQIDADVEAAWHAAADSQIDGAICQRYTVPVSPVPPVLATAGLILRCFFLYQRRNVPDESNPFSLEAKEVRAKLNRIGRGDDPLTPDIEKARPVATIVSEPSRLSHIRDGDGTEATVPQRHLN